MRGLKHEPVEIGGLLNVEDQIDPKHPLRKIKRQCKTALLAMNGHCPVVDRESN